MMMSRIRFVSKRLFPALFYFLIALQGCIEDDMTMCPTPNNLSLTFRVEVAVTGEVVNVGSLPSVDVLLYDDGGRLVEHKHVEQSDLAIYPGARFTVTPGEYRVLAWANASSGSRFSTLVPGESLIDQGYIEMTGAGDSLYYAPAKPNAYRGAASLRAEETTAADPYALYRVIVPKGGGEVVKEMPFTRAYRSVSIYLKGLEHLNGGIAALGQIRAEAYNLPTRYNFLFDTQLERRNDVRTFATALTPDDALPVARFYSAYGPISENMSFTVTHLPDEPGSVTIILRDYLSHNPPSSFDDIDILVEFYRTDSGNVQVRITLPDWSNRPVTPEM